MPGSDCKTHSECSSDVFHEAKLEYAIPVIVTNRSHHKHTALNTFNHHSQSVSTATQITIRHGFTPVQQCYTCFEMSMRATELCHMIRPSSQKQINFTTHPGYLYPYLYPDLYPSTYILELKPISISVFLFEYSSLYQYRSPILHLQRRRMRGPRNSAIQVVGNRLSPTNRADCTPFQLSLSVSHSRACRRVRFASCGV